MKKAILMMAAAILLCTQGVCSAKTSCTVTVEENKVTCRVEADGIFGKGITLIAAPRGEELTGRNIYAIELLTEKKTDFTFTMPQNAVGDAESFYTIYLKNGDTEEETVDFAYVQPEVLAGILSGIRSAGADGFDQYLNEETNGIRHRAAFSSIGAELDLYEKLTDKKAAAKQFYQLLGNETLENKEFVRRFNQAAYTAAINQKTETAEAILEKMNPGFENMAYADMTKERKAWICGYFGKNLPISEFSESFTAANVLYQFNNARYSDFESLFQKYETEFTLKNNSSYQTYRGMSAEQKAEVGETLVKSNESTKAQKLSDVASKLSAALKSANSNDSGSGNGSGSGSGGTKGSTTGAGVVKKTEESSGGITVMPGTKQDAEPFEDLGSVSWAKDAILSLYEKNIISGMGDKQFMPQELVTREQMVKMLVTAIGLEIGDAECSMTDAEKGQWYYPYLAAGVKEGIVSGISETEFGIGRPVTRQDAAVLLLRAAQKSGKLPQPEREYAGFADEGEISEYARDAVKTLYCAGILSGRENGFAPFDACTRAEAAKMIYELLGN